VLDGDPETVTQMPSKYLLTQQVQASFVSVSDTNQDVKVK